MSEVTVKSDYRADGRQSFFGDMLAAQGGDVAASERLERYAKEWNAEAEKRGLEQRVNPNALYTGQGAEFAPPWWLVDKFAGAARAGRPLADLVGTLPLPKGVSSINIPRMSTGTTVAYMNDGAAVPGGDLVTANASSAVVTLAGIVDVSQQLLEQSPAGFDTYAYLDMTKAYNRALESQMVTGTGSNGQLLGLLNVSVPSGNSVAGSSTDNTQVQTFIGHVGQISAAVGNNRLYPPEVMLMAPRRWYFFASSVDSSNRPLATPHDPGARTNEATAGGSLPVGRLHGLPVYADAAIPAGSSTDSVIVTRPSDMFLWEGETVFSVVSNSLSGTLQSRLSLHRAVAFVPHRYPSATAFLTGLPQPTNF